jgi:hypothetical protein
MKGCVVLINLPTNEVDIEAGRVILALKGQ